jgi:hypothetical protein
MVESSVFTEMFFIFWEASSDLNKHGVIEQNTGGARDEGK